MIETIGNFDVQGVEKSSESDHEPKESGDGHNGHSEGPSAGNSANEKRADQEAPHKGSIHNDDADGKRDAGKDGDDNGGEGESADAEAAGERSADKPLGLSQVGKEESDDTPESSLPVSPPHTPSEKRFSDNGACAFFETSWENLRNIRKQQKREIQDIPKGKTKDTQLEQKDVLRAIAAVTEGIREGVTDQGYEGFEFALLDVNTLLASEQFLPFPRPGRGIMIAHTQHFHHALYRVRRAPEDQQDVDVQLDVYDSAPNWWHETHMFDKVQRSVQDRIHALGWLKNRRDATAPLRFGITHHESPGQLGKHPCGLHVILNAYAAALGLTPNGGVCVSNNSFYDLAWEVVMFTIDGCMDWQTLHAFLECYGYVEPDGRVPRDRRFIRSHPFVDDNEFDEYVQSRQYVDRLRFANPDLPNTPTLRQVLFLAGYEDARDVPTETLLEYYQIWRTNGRGASLTPLRDPSPGTSALQTTLPRPTVPDEEESSLETLWDVFRAYRTDELDYVEMAQAFQTEQELRDFYNECKGTFIAMLDDMDSPTRCQFALDGWHGRTSAVEEDETPDEFEREDGSADEEKPARISSDDLGKDSDIPAEGLPSPQTQEELWDILCETERKSSVDEQDEGEQKEEVGAAKEEGEMMEREEDVKQGEPGKIIQRSDAKRDEDAELASMFGEDAGGEEDEGEEGALIWSGR